jgi:plastocyanin
MNILPRLRRAPAVVLSLLVLLFGLFGVAPAQAAVGNSPNAITWTVLVGQESSDMAIQGMAFAPDDIWIDQGDSINFRANSAEIHTVSYGTPPLPPTSIENLLADAVPRVGGPVFDPTEPWSNSGILTTMSTPEFPTVTSYAQKFTTRGDFTFYCLIHDQVMSMTVHVQAPHATYPSTTGQVAAQAAAQNAAIIAHGLQLQADVEALASPTHVFVGASDATAMVMRFMPENVTVPLGATVTFDMTQNHVFVPHTVSFDTLTHNGQLVDSGVIIPFGPSAIFPVTFDQAGTWTYDCQIHDEMGMDGSVTVTP